ncbi:hypothetical protein CSPX01_00114 [Colletotrichum filicis]|nr:hypothetical protein CSPX01_00114 [Colletotrichum filicis]
MSETHGPLTGRNISVCGKFENRTQDDIVEQISRLGGTGSKNKLPDDAFCVICTSEAAEKNKTVQVAVAKDVPLVSVQWLDDGGSPANIQQFLIGPIKDNAEDESGVSPEIQSTPPPQIIEPPNPKTPETRSGKDRYEGNTESVESTPIRKPSQTLMDRLGSAYQAITGTPRRKSVASPPVVEATGSPESHASKNSKMPEKAPAHVSESNEMPVESGREGSSESNPIQASIASPETQVESGREGSSESNPIQVSSTSPEAQIESGREGSSESNPIQASSARPEAQVGSGREGSSESNPIQISSASPEAQIGSGREGSSESNPIKVSSTSPELPKTTHQSPVLKQESRGDTDQQPDASDKDQKGKTQRDFEQNDPPQDREQSTQSSFNGGSDKENQGESSNESGLYVSTPVQKTQPTPKQGDSVPEKQKSQANNVFQRQSEIWRGKQPEPRRVFQSTESDEGVHHKQAKDSEPRPLKPALVHSNKQRQRVDGLQSPDSTATVVRDDAFDPYKWAETHALGGDQMERHPRFSDWKDFPHPKTGLWIEIDDFEHTDRKIWVLARGITYKNQLAVETIGFREGQSRGLSLSAPAYKSEIATLRRKGIGQFPPGDPKDFTGLKGRNRFGDGQQNPFHVVFFAEAHGAKNNGDCLVLYDGGKAMSKTDVVRAGGSRWSRLIESHRRPEISVAPGKVLWPDESLTQAVASTGNPPVTRLASSPPVLPTPSSVPQPRFVQQAPAGAPGPQRGAPFQRPERTNVTFSPTSVFPPTPATRQPSAAPTAPTGFPPTLTPPTRYPPMNMAQGFQQPAFRQYPELQNWVPPPVGWPPQNFLSYQHQAAPYYVLPPSQSAYSTRDVSMDPSSSFRGSSQPPAAFRNPADPPNLKSRGPATLFSDQKGDWYINTNKVTFPDGYAPTQAGSVEWLTDKKHEWARTSDARLWRISLER